MLFLAVASAVAQTVRYSACPELKIGAKAPDFTLPNPVDGKTDSLKDFDYAKVLVIVFTCNHCPTAEMYEGRIKQIAADDRDKGVALVAIQPNGLIGYSERSHDDLGDSPEEMKIRAEYRDFNFPYLYDGETQAVARQYGPIATPHLYVFVNSASCAIPATSTITRGKGSSPSVRPATPSAPCLPPILFRWKRPPSSGA
jgi:peroxiredoxin